MIRSLLLPVLFLFASVTPAQDSPAPATPPAPAAREKPTPLFVSIDFPGGTLAAFVAALREKEPKVNVILAPLANEAKLPRIELRGAGIEQALEAACAVAESKALIRMKSFKGQGEAVFTILAQTPVVTMMGPDGEKTMPATVANALAGEVADQLMIEVFSLQDVLERGDGFGLSITTVLSAIEAAAGGEGQGTKLRWHKESGILVASAKKSQMNVVRSVLRALEGDVKQRRFEASAADKSKANKEAK